MSETENREISDMGEKDGSAGKYKHIGIRFNTGCSIDMELIKRAILEQELREKRSKQQ